MRRKGASKYPAIAAFVILGLFSAASGSERSLSTVGGKVKLCHFDRRSSTFSKLTVPLIAWQVGHIHHRDDCCVAVQGSFLFACIKKWAMESCAAKSCQRVQMSSSCRCQGAGDAFNPATHRCQSTGPGCTLSVPSAPTADHANFSHCLGTALGQPCYGRCEEGFMGPVSAVCKRNGAWERVKGSCRAGRPCDVPSSPVGGTVDCNVDLATGKVLTGNTCELTCRQFYTPSLPVPTITCLDGAMDATATCIGDPCDVSVPPTISHGALDCGSRTSIPSGDNCTVQCELHFTPSTPTVTCTAGSLQTASCTPASGCASSPCDAVQHSNGTCMDAPGGGFTCGCLSGFAWEDGRGCTSALHVCPEYTHVSLVAGYWGIYPPTGTIPGGGDGGPATEAFLSRPEGLALDAEGNLLIADVGNSRLRLVNASSGNISTLVALDASQQLHGVAVGCDGAIYFTVSSPQCPYGNGAGVYMLDPMESTPQLLLSWQPCSYGLAVNPETCDLYVAHLDGIHRIAMTAGMPSDQQLVVQDVPLAPRGYGFSDVAFHGGQLHANGMQGVMRYALHDDTYTPTVLVYNSILGLEQRGVVYSSDFNGLPAPEGLTAISDDTITIFNGVFGIEFDAQGNLFLAAWGAARVFKIEATSGNVSVVLGYGWDRELHQDRFYPNDPQRTQITTPGGMVLGPDGSLYVSVDNRVLKLWC